MTGYILSEDTLVSLEKNVLGDPMVHGLFGIGKGNQRYSVGDLTYLGQIWYQDWFEVENGFKDASGNLKTFTDAKYASRLIDYVWKATAKQDKNHKMLLNGGDFLTIKPHHEAEEYLSANNIEYMGDGQATVELGAKRPTNLDTWEAMQGLSRGYTDRSFLQSHEDLTPAQITFTPPAVGSIVFSVPDSVLTASYLPRITLSLTLAVQDDPDADIGRVAIRVKIGTTNINFGNIVATTIGGLEIPEIDVTAAITQNASNTVNIEVFAVSGTLPILSASGTMHFYKRSEVK